MHFANSICANSIKIIFFYSFCLIYDSDIFYDSQIAKSLSKKDLSFVKKLLQSEMQKWIYVLASPYLQVAKFKKYIS